MNYMRWAKVHGRVRFELTPSGIPPATLGDIGADFGHVMVAESGTYGHPPLIDAIAARYNVSTERIMPVPGASCANFIGIAACVGHGEAVLVERPLYDPIDQVVAFLGLQPLELPRRPEDGFAVRREDVEAGLQAGARAVVLTNLHNPSGQAISRGDMAGVAELCARHEAALVVDEVYLDSAHLALGEERWTAASLGKHVVAINSLTKVYGLSGLRIGWLIAAPQRIERMQAIMDVLSVNNASPSMSLAVRGFQRIAALEERFRRAYAAGQAIYRSWLKRNGTVFGQDAPEGPDKASGSEPHVGVETRGGREESPAGQAARGAVPPDGPGPRRHVLGYPSCGALFECVRLPQGVSSWRLNELLVKRFDTQVTPGAFFGLDDHVRLFIGGPPELLAEGLERVSTGVHELCS